MAYGVLNFVLFDLKKNVRVTKLAIRAQNAIFKSLPQTVIICEVDFFQERCKY